MLIVHELPFIYQLHELMARDPAAAQAEAAAQMATRADPVERLALRLLQAICHARLGNYVQAEYELTRALRQAKQRGMHYLVAEARDELAAICLMRGQIDAALRQWLDCFDAALQEDSRFGLVRAHLGIGKVLFALGKHDEAKEQHLRSVELSYALKDNSMNSAIHLCLAADYLKLAEFDRAYVALAIAEDNLAHSPYPDKHRSELLIYRSQIRAGRGEWHKAVNELDEAIRMATAGHYNWHHAFAELESGRVHFVLNRLATARSHLLIASSKAHSIASHLLEMQAEELLYSISKQEQRYEEALVHHRRYTELTLELIDNQNRHQIDPTTRRRLRRMESELALAQSEQENSSLMARLQSHEQHIQALKIEAETDPLTGVFNRRALEDRLQRELYTATQLSRPFSLLMLDIDHFKQVNDRFSHLTGDAVLKTVAELIQSCCRQDEFITRYGGEEFVILLPGAGADTARHIAERIRLKISHHDWFTLHPELLTLTISIGTAELQAGESTHDLLARADAHLYQAKAGGRNRTCC
ncbi:GGDEF domain-containing protein [Chitinilyticum piscinae]|uniref:diguanylate cyclase n=1 Tax=Chitinilyticum piscinae TaxID=2866724 RepID=A0A8J7KGW4_9NEIS|nr:GGDEF domain-containing protein [Chitinilyticum piscinae]MBE9610794.1 diguanylate cyclase [Chitinilyticum piscinae]